MNSTIFTLNWKDLGKGAITAVITAFLTTISVGIYAGRFPSVEELKAAGLTSLAAGCAYIVKNLLTNNQGEFLKADQ
jgi:hypothetical protein